jgi:hypothetical protein
VHVSHFNFDINKKNAEENRKQQMKHNKNRLRIIVAKLPVEKYIRNDNHQQQKNQHESIKLHKDEFVI